MRRRAPQSGELASGTPSGRPRPGDGALEIGRIGHGSGSEHRVVDLHDSGRYCQVGVRGHLYGPQNEPVLVRLDGAPNLSADERYIRVRNE